MRRIKKKQIIAILQSMLEINEIIVKQDVNSRQNLLVDCQDSAISLGNTIEETEGTECKTIKLLEEYCELLYEASMVSEQMYDFQRCLNAINMKIHEIQESIKTDIPSTYELIFLPYKYSMWDSMETVWVAAKSDRRCECKVVPIPYYELDEDGKGICCYEGEQFPNESAIIDYRQIDLSQERPDAIFIHNPYDDCNMVTSIDPLFYSSKLVNYTDMLVYIPYFVAGSYSKGGDWLKGMASWPGIRNAHKVIMQGKVQEEAMLSVGVPKEKLVVLGHPKLDKSINLLKENYLKGLKWRERIKNKKAILINTSISFLLQDTEKWFEVVEHILNCIQNESNAILIWRPHPLLEATIRTMRRNIYHRYLAFKQRLSNSEQVIIDETADAYCAMAISDALISDYSSLVFQYIPTKKPVYVIKGYRVDNEKVFVTCDYYESYLEAEMPLESFISMVMNNEDIKKESRYYQMAKSVENLDGTAGRKIFEYIIDELENREKQ